MEPIKVLNLSAPWPDKSKLSKADNGASDTELSRKFAEDGLVIVPGLLDDDAIDAYCDGFIREHPDRAAGWQHATPYSDFEFVADLVCDERIASVAQEIIGEPMAVHLNLSNWRSTTRNWHQDGYLNPDSNLDWYVAVWIALDDIHPDSGPFEFVRGSHRVFDVIRNRKMLAALEPHEQGPDWPRHSERILTPWFEGQIAELDLNVEQFLAKKGDCLFWHARTLHRGSTPVNPDIERRAMIAHYSGITHRPDMPRPVKYKGGWKFPIKEPIR